MFFAVHICRPLRQQSAQKIQTMTTLCILATSLCARKGKVGKKVKLSEETITKLSV